MNQNTDQKNKNFISLILSSFNQEHIRSIFYQIFTLVLLAAIIYFFVGNMLYNMDVRDIQTGYDFLNKSAEFQISETLLKYSPSDSYAYAIFLGFLNTLKVASLGIILSSIIGLFVGVFLLSKNWLLKTISFIYVEIFRNTPLLLQLIFWYALLNQALPSPRQALEPIENFLFSNRGFYFPLPNWHQDYNILLWILGLCCIGLYFFKKWVTVRHEKTGKTFPFTLSSLVILGVVLGGSFFMIQTPLTFSIPQLQGFNIQGGQRITPEFIALLGGLTLYTAAYIAEDIRAGILSVPIGQWEACDSLAIKRFVCIRHIILPQALRVSIPPITNQYLNLTKNSSLAVAIGYPDLVSIGNTTFNQTGQVLEIILIFMLVYLTICLTASMFMNWFNKRLKKIER